MRNKSMNLVIIGDDVVPMKCVWVVRVSVYGYHRAFTSEKRALLHAHEMLAAARATIDSNLEWQYEENDWERTWLSEQTKVTVEKIPLNPVE